VIEQRALNFAPLLHPVNQIVFNGQPQNVKWVFVAGRALKEKGRVMGVDHGALLKAAQAASRRIKPFIQP
jgi:5-methylthioadenosine/S-adenosylhomocysteine deaminase